MYNFDNTIFDELTLPEGVDKETFIEKVCLDNAELELLYTNPLALKSAIGLWCRVHYEQWCSIWDSLHKDYEVLENYDRREEIEETGSSSSKGDSKGVVSNLETAFDTYELKPTTSGNSESQGNSHSDNVNKRIARLRGNIGVTTNQQMLTSEIELRLKYNFIEMLADDFKEYFIIQVY